MVPYPFLFAIVHHHKCFFFIASHHKSASPQFDIVASIPATLILFLQTWVLSDFMLFENAQKKYTYEPAEDKWVIVVDKKGTIHSINGLAAEKAGYSIYEMVGNNIATIMEVKNKENKFVSPLKLIQGSVDTYFSEIIVRFNKTGELFNLQSSMKSVTLPDKTEAFIWVLINTSLIESLRIQKKMVQTTSAELKKAFNDMAFIMNITSHDLRTPLKTITELTGMIKKESLLPMPNRSEEYLGYIESLSVQSLTLSTQMIEYMRIGIAEKKMEWLQMPQLMELLKQRWITVFTKNLAKLTYEGLTEIYCDPKQITELLANFIDNSIKYQTVELPVIAIKVTETETMYEFSIKDNGIGIHQDFIPKLFLQYSREGKGKASGTGIGLFLCKKIIESNNGNISISSNKPQNGITIVFTIAKQI